MGRLRRAFSGVVDRILFVDTWRVRPRRTSSSGVVALILVAGGGVPEWEGLLMGPSEGCLVFLKYLSIATISSVPV